MPTVIMELDKYVVLLNMLWAAVWHMCAIFCVAVTTLAKIIIKNYI